MKLPNWFKITWWGILTVLSGIIVFKRAQAILAGTAVTFDIFIFLIFIALMLVPIFSEIEFFGIKLKKEIEELKEDIKIKIGDIKSEIRNTQSQTVSQTIQTYGPPPTDSMIPQLQTEIEKYLAKKQNLSSVEDTALKYESVPAQNIELFKIRYNIEQQLRRIWEHRFQFGDDFITRQPSHARIIQNLFFHELIDKQLADITKEVLAVCNYGVHGQPLTDAQKNFATKNASKIIDVLSKIN